MSSVVSTSFSKDQVSSRPKCVGVASVVQRAGLWGACFAAVALTGCGGGRTVTIRQSDYVNTAMFSEAESGKRGEPLRVDIVCVFPADLQKPENQVLNPNVPVTNDLWFSQVNGKNAFSIPEDQVYRLDDNQRGYGVWKHPSLRGAAYDGAAPVVIKGITFKEKRGWKEGGALLAKDAVVYVFANFVDRSGNVLKEPPAKFYPLRNYSKNLVVEVGVAPGNRQYIRAVE